jgi:hypothetical protein
MRWPRVLLLGSVVLLCPGSPMSPGALARETWSEIGHIQILEGPEKIWAFVEVVRITDYTDELFLHLMSKHPDRETVSQTVFTIDRLGNVTKTPIARNTGPGLDPDLKPIFRLSDGFYQQFPATGFRPEKSLLFVSHVVNQSRTIPAWTSDSTTWADGEARHDCCSR